MGKLGIVYRHEDGKTTRIDTRAWDFSLWVKEKLSRAARNQMLLRHQPTPEEIEVIEEAIASGRIAAESAAAHVTRRKAEALLALCDDVETLAEVFLAGGLVVLQPKGIDVREVPSTRLTEEELRSLRPRIVS
jgi:hypothetical protein